MRLFVVVTFAVFLLTSCATLKQEQVNALPDDTNILIISAIGKSFNVCKYNTISGNDLIESIDVWFWSLNPLLENAIFEALEGTRFKISKYHDYENKKDLKLKRDDWIHELDKDYFEKDVITFCRNNNIDKIIVLTEDQTDWHNAYLAGYGFYQYKSLLNWGKSVAGLGYACMKLNWYDVKTLNKKSISNKYAIFKVPPDIVDKIYENQDWYLFRNLREKYRDLLESVVSSMTVMSALSE